MSHSFKDFPISTVFRKLYEDPKYLSMFTLVAALLVFYPTVNYAFISYFLWTVTSPQYNGLRYLVYVNYNIISSGEFAVKSLIFIIILSATALISIGISQLLTKSTLKKFEEETKN